MLARILSAAVDGIDGYPVTVEVDFRYGMPSFSIVGLPDVSVKESRERVVAAIKNSGFNFSPQRITVNLAPADIKKEGPSFDLPIALGILAASETISADSLANHAFLGELGLNGELRTVKGILPSVIGLKKAGIKSLIIPESNAREAGFVEGIKIFPLKNLIETVHFVLGQKKIAPFLSRQEESQKIPAYDVDFSEVKGQAFAKRALEVAAAGNHNVLLIGPPGSGKTLLARRLPTIMPEMDLDEILEATKIHSVSGLTGENLGLIDRRPFRAPHHKTSASALIGGGSNPRPGEVSLAHKGVLFLDEFSEFSRDVLECLRQPLEDRSVQVVRISKVVRFPSDFLLIVASNPCPCGYYGAQSKMCVCTPAMISKYQSKISGPLLDRIDLHISVPALKIDELTDDNSFFENSLSIRERVVRARQIQKYRFAQCDFLVNSQMSGKHLKQFCSLNKEGKELIKNAIRKLGLSARAYDRVLRVARTIADLAGGGPILPVHLAEAISFRIVDRRST